MGSIKKSKPIEVKNNKSLVELLNDMLGTGFQGKNLASAYSIIKKMIEDKDTTIILGYSGSLSTTGQWKQVQWLIENNLVDIIVPTGANISEDIIEAMGFNYYQCPVKFDDTDLFKEGYNRYHDILGKEDDYLEMTELIAEFILSLESNYSYSSREFLYQFGIWLNDRNIKSIVTAGAMNNVPIFCPAIVDSPYGDAALIAKSKGFKLSIDTVKDYTEFMSLAECVVDTGVIYIGGGVPKDFIQLFSVTADLMYENRRIPNRDSHEIRKGTNESYYPHKYAVQITTDSPQWGGLSGCTFTEAISWGKESDNGNLVQCYCDATIALPIIIQALKDSLDLNRKKKNLFTLVK
ncbi:deoxyhypusine synthase family protein [Acidobacteriota bacterium]